MSLRALVASLVLVLSSLVVVTATSAPAHADECYSWTRTLSEGASGPDVAELQVRVAGWAGYGVTMAIDGQYGPRTRAAVASFQSAYGLSADGVAGSATYNQIYALQDADCTPAHFSWAEVDGGCGQGGYSGGSVSAATVQQNLLRAMWRAEALRHRMGDQPLTVTSGFRSKACDQSVGGSGSGSTPTAPPSTWCRRAAVRRPCAPSPPTPATPASAASSAPATPVTTTTPTSTSARPAHGAPPPAGSDHSAAASQL